MLWYTDPELFIYGMGSGLAYGYGIYRITKKYNVPLLRGDLTYVEDLDFCKHLSLGNNINRESDYDALKSLLRRYYPIFNEEKIKMVNCQGLVVYCDFSKGTYTWSRIEEHDSIFYREALDNNINPSVTVLEKILEAVEKLNSEFVAEISSLKDKLNNEVSNLQEQLNQEKSDREALEKKVLDPSIKLHESRGAGGGSADAEPWMSGSTVPSNWVPFDQLVVQNIPMGTPLKITAAPGASEFGEDTTTNVQANRFCQGIYPIVVVNVADLNPNNGKARFDPDVWCSINSAGNSYAARKPSESEMSLTFDPHMG